jgi:hypothetical protein
MGIDWSSKIENKAQKDLSQYGEIIHFNHHEKPIVQVLDLGAMIAEFAEIDHFGWCINVLKS